MTMKKEHQLGIALILLGWVAIFASVSGCDAPHIIGEAPDPCFVASECVDVVVEEFCPVPDVCPAIPEPVECPTVEECPGIDVVEPDNGADTCDLTVPVGHRPIECRGKGHSSLDCTEVCRFTPNGTRICQTHCTDARTV